MKNIKISFFIAFGILVAISLIIGACNPAAPDITTTDEPNATSTEVIKLTYATAQPTTHPMSIVDAEWINRIEEACGGRIEITPYYGGTLVNPAMSITELEKGVVNISDFSSATMKDGYDIDKAVHAFFYGITSPKTGQFDWELARRVYNEVRAEFPEIDAEWQSIKVLARGDISSYQMFSVKPVRKIDDFKGMLIKSSGTNVNIMTALGAEGIPMPMSEVYTALQKSTVTGALAPYESGKSFNFFEVADYVTYLNMGSSPSPHRGMNWETWNSLPPDIQQVFEDNIDWWGVNISEGMYKADQAGIEVGKELNREFINLSADEEEKFYQICEQTVLEEMNRLEAKDIPAAQIFKEVRRLIVEDTTTE
jgi:TRAP-type C4-dicarboxylate transport system substrate-binding protein